MTDNDSGQDLPDPPDWVEMFAMALLALVVATLVVLWALD